MTEDQYRYKPRYPEYVNELTVVCNYGLVPDEAYPIGKLKLLVKAAREHRAAGAGNGLGTSGLACSIAELVARAISTLDSVDHTAERTQLELLFGPLAAEGGVDRTEPQPFAQRRVAAQKAHFQTRRLPPTSKKHERTTIDPRHWRQYYEIPLLDLLAARITVHVTWTDPADIGYGTALGPAQLNATASVPGTFTYDPPPGTALDAGTGHLLTTFFTPTDDRYYRDATATVRITVTKATPTLTWADPADIASGTALGPAQLNATASVPGTFTYDPPPGTTLDAGTGHLLTTCFTPTDDRNIRDATATVRITVTKTTWTRRRLLVGMTSAVVAATVGYEGERLLARKLGRSQLVVRIVQPGSNAVVDTPVTLTGSASGIRADHELWIVVRPIEASAYYPQLAALEVLRGMWVGKAGLGDGTARSAGQQFVVYVVLADHHAGDAFRDQLAAGDFSGLQRLPAGTTEAAAVTLQLRPGAAP